MTVAQPVVHLELRTTNLPRACAFYTQLFGWRTETIHTASGGYVAIEISDGIQGGVTEHDSGPSLWVPYIEVPDIAHATARSRALGARVTLEPREGPAGWRSGLTGPDGADIALWQPKL
jgi:uncharacterized protein